jgi:hypothetical protein
MITKVCSNCKNLKPITDFYKRANSRDGTQSSCKLCQKIHSSTYAKINKNKTRQWKLKSNYNLTPENYEQMLKAQNGRCAICQTTSPGGRFHVWHIDHCHTSGKVRGLLCHCCNMGLGYFKDNQFNLHQALSYLNHDHKAPGH